MRLTEQALLRNVVDAPPRSHAGVVAAPKVDNSLLNAQSEIDDAINLHVNLLTVRISIWTDGRRTELKLEEFRLAHAVLEHLKLPKRRRWAW